MALPLSQEGPEVGPEEEPSSSSGAAPREVRARQVQQEPLTPPPPFVGSSPSSSSSALGSASASSSSGSRKRLPSKDRWYVKPAWKGSDGFPSAVAFAQALADAADVKEEAQAPVPKVQDYASTMEALRRQHCQELLEKAKKVDPEATVRTLRAKMRLEFSTLSSKSKEALCRRAHENCSDEIKDDLLARAELYKLEAEEGTQRKARPQKWLCTKSFLLIWNHRSWVWRREGSFGSLSEAVQFLREDSRANGNWDKFQTEKGKTGDQVKA